MYTNAMEAIKLAEDEIAKGEYVEWHPGMFTESLSQNNVLKESTKHQQPLRKRLV